MILYMVESGDKPLICRTYAEAETNAKEGDVISAIKIDDVVEALITWVNKGYFEASRIEIKDSD